MSNWRLFKITVRGSFFIVYFWFGLLKVLYVSSAYSMVSDLLLGIFPTANPDIFIFYFGLVEMFIGLMFLFPKFTKVATFLTTIHLISCFLPFIVVPDLVWKSFGVLTQEGQYIVKNVFIIAGLIGLNHNSEAIRKDK
ncbi:MAG: hypothetical protein UT34_C0001G0226 [candidate division WS6 bacterium GW2011_GWF2_39_15]|uniref:DoxX family protein n=1 Tax=candidate division WS6 bacterium GW2011_GWF2_39_15 TaxID=1619100 RepID=A0A0G0N050_9BACT|nr:MAG: hypothetical protein UT34_C0001G0226 [candidate division WS6 bacterium GW2011_GWF2_39_15]